MREITLKFRVADRDNFNEIKDGLKTVETRAATERYKNIKAGDVLVITCGKKCIRKKVKRVRHFKNITSMTKAIPLKKIMPSVHSIAEMRKAYYGYPEYKEKIKRFGLITLEI